MLQAVAFGAEIAYFCSKLTKESVVDVEFSVTKPNEPIKACTVQAMLLLLRHRVAIPALAKSGARPAQCHSGGTGCSLRSKALPYCTARRSPAPHGKRMTTHRMRFVAWRRMQS